MTKAHKITYKVFLFERVKKKIIFFNTETYPVRIRLTAGTRTLYLKSHFFTLMRQKKYQQEVLFNEKRVSLNNIIQREEELMQYILEKERTRSSLDLIRQKYIFFSHDILHELDENFKKFLIDFFYAEDLPAYSLFIKNDGINHTSEFILNNLEMSLHPAVLNKLLQSAVEKAPPYIPLIKFFREKINTSLPIFPVYQWQQPPVSKAFTAFIKNRFPEYQLHNPTNYINKLVKENAYGKRECN